MADLLNKIEHRWGRRFGVNIPVRAAVSSSEIECRLRDLSLSGALIKSESEHDFRLNTLIEVIISLPAFADGRATVKAHVTRKHAQEVAIEWCEFAPHAVKELLRSPEVRGLHR
ncbi:MAG TPA: PilZ domain-containing protein [Steroidobacteraceae bacterium]|nr:PilZ domain-containing protein [Steroidobacteraceae bacterium]